MISTLIAEATVCDFKEALEVKKPKSWLKSISAFANTAGGTLFFGVDNSHNVVGLTDPQKDAEDISRLIKERISPAPRFILTAEQEYGKAVLVLSVPKGTHTPYYYKADGIREAYIRFGGESIVAPDHILHELILDGMNESFDALVSKYNANDFAFSSLRARYKKHTGKSFVDSFLVSFGLVDEDTDKLTNAGVIIADESPLRQSRLFCVRWNGLTKAGGLIDAIDSAEYTGSVILLLENGMNFIKRHNRMMWRKAPTSRIEMPEYAERSCLEALTNALIHRSYLELGSEVHIDIFDDRLEITSPGGMVSGKNIQDLDLSKSIISKRRNPVLADVFARLGYMERQGSGIKKIIENYETEMNYSEDRKPEFFSDSSQFSVILKNLNYGKSIENLVIDSKNQAIKTENTAIESQNPAIETAISKMNANKNTRNKAVVLFKAYGTEGVFGRNDIATLISTSYSSAGELIAKLKDSGLITEVKGQGKGKYKFNKDEPKNV